MEVEEAMETQAMDAEENLENAKENLLDAEDSHFATMLALTEAERAVEIAVEAGVWAAVNKARGVMEGAQSAAIKTEKALRFANMERDKTKNKLDGIIEDQFFRGEAHKQHADILLKITRRHIRVRSQPYLISAAILSILYLSKSRISILINFYHQKRSDTSSLQTISGTEPFISQKSVPASLALCCLISTSTVILSILYLSLKKPLFFLR